MKKCIFAVVALLMLIFFFGQPLFAQETQMVRLTVSTPPIFNAIGMFLARELGYFAEQGLDVEIETMNSGTQQILPLLAAGKIDAAATGLTSGLYNAIGRGISLVIVADAGHYAENTTAKSIQKIVVSKKLYPGELNKETLKGKTFAVLFRGSIHEIFVGLFLERYGLTLEDIDLVSVPFTGMNAALAGGSVFGAPLSEPYLTIAKKKDLIVEIIDCDTLYPGQQSMGVIFTKKLAEEKPGLGRRFMTAYLKGVRYYNDYLEGKGEEKIVFAALAKYTPIKDLETFRAMGKPNIYSEGHLNKDSMEKDIGWYFEHGYIEIRPDVENIVNESFAKAATRALDENNGGEYRDGAGERKDNE